MRQIKDMIRKSYEAMNPRDLLTACEEKARLLDAFVLAEWRNLLHDCDTRLMFEVASERGILIDESQS